MVKGNLATTSELRVGNSHMESITGFALTSIPAEGYNLVMFITSLRPLEFVTVDLDLVNLDPAG